MGSLNLDILLPALLLGGETPGARSASPERGDGLDGEG